MAKLPSVHRSEDINVVFTGTESRHGLMHVSVISKLGLGVSCIVFSSPFFLFLYIFQMATSRVKTPEGDSQWGRILRHLVILFSLLWSYC